METPQRKRRRLDPSCLAQARPVNKRARAEPLVSPSPEPVVLCALSDERENDVVMESDVPDSPNISLKQMTHFSVSFHEPRFDTPTNGMDDSFSKLNLTTSTHEEKAPATPLPLRPRSETTKSVKKSARKTPGSAKSCKSKLSPFRIKVTSFPISLSLVLGHVTYRASSYCGSHCLFPEDFLPC